MGYQFNPQVAEIVDGLRGTSRIHLPMKRQASKRRENLEVDDLRSGEALRVQALPDTPAVRAIVPERGDENTGVYDDHRPSRSFRTTASALLRGTSPPVR